MQNCEYCGRPLTEGQETYCSPECEAAAQKKNPKRRCVHEAHLSAAPSICSWRAMKSYSQQKKPMNKSMRP